MSTHLKNPNFQSIPNVVNLYFYKYYNRYKCGNKKCTHVIIYHHNLNIDDASNVKLTIPFI